MLDPGENFTKTWRFQNSGTCDWGDGYSLVFAGGDMFNSSPNTPLKISIPAGQTGDVSINLQAPQRGGEHTGFWKFQNPEGQQFGTGYPDRPFWTSITVSFFTDNSGGDGAAPPGVGPTPVTAGSGEANCTPKADQAVESQVLDLINAARASAGLQPLDLQPQLSAAALQHSTDMACHNYVDHTGSDGSTWVDRTAAQGYANAASARENIYVGDPAFGGDAQGAFNWWMNSAIHRANILYPDVSDIGIGYIYLPGSQYGGYYTTVFARP